MQNWCKSEFVDATELFELPYMQIWTVLSNRSYTGFKLELLVSQLRLRTLLTTKQIYRLWIPIDMKLDMCDVTFKSISFQISQHINIVLKS